MDGREQNYLDEWEIERLAHTYAQAVDRRDQAQLLSVFVADAVLEGPGWRRVGAEIAEATTYLDNAFAATWHSVSTQAIELEGDRARGETYCVARHLLKGSFSDNQVMTMTIRYQDVLVRTEAGWRIQHRRMLVDWTETSTIQSGPRA